MTYPNQPAGYPPYPPAPGTQPPPPGYYQQPQTPQWGSPPPGYPPQTPPYYPGYQQAAPPAPVLARGTLEDFLDQPVGGGGAATSKFFTPQRMNGHWIQVRVNRDLNNNDVRQQTDKFGTPLTFKSNGKPKFQTLVPCTVLNSSEPQTTGPLFADGVTVFLKGIVFENFKAAMQVAGITDPTRAFALGQLGGAVFYMVSAGTKQFGQGNPTNMFDFQYTPNGRELLETTQTVILPQQPQAPVPPTPPPPVQAPAVPTAAGDPNLAYYQATGQLPPTVTAGAIPAPVNAPQQLPPTVTAGAIPAPVNAPQQPPPPPYAQTGAPPVPPPGAGIPSAAPPAPPQGYAPAPPPPGPAGYAPQGTVPAPNGYAPGQALQQPGQPQLDPEKAALLLRLQGQG